jgi:hypothetical protein
MTALLRDMSQTRANRFGNYRRKVSPEGFAGRFRRKVSPEGFAGRFHRKVLPEIFAGRNFRKCLLQKEDTECNVA